MVSDCPLRAAASSSTLYPIRGKSVRDETLVQEMPIGANLPLFIRGDVVVRERRRKKGTH